MEIEYGILPKKIRDKNKKGMLGISLQKTRDLEALARGEKVPGLNPKLSTKQLQSVKKVQRGKDYKGRGDVPTEKQVQERAKQAQVKTFDKGGDVFPDLSGDGKITQKDILMGRGVVKKSGGGNIKAYSNIQLSGRNFSGQY